MDAAVAGLIGAGIGASSSLITVWIQARYQAKRERSKFIMEFAANDRKEAIESARLRGASAAVAPVALYAHYHSRLLEMIERGKVDDADLSKLSQETDAIWKTVKKIQEQRTAADLDE